MEKYDADVVKAPRAAIAFTGGKDSVLALHLVSAKFRALVTNEQTKAQLHNIEQLNPVILVSFRPAGQQDEFKAHGYEWTLKLASSLGMPLVVKEISNTPSFEDSYRSRIKELADEYQVTRLVTGDIEDIGEGFMDRAVTQTGVELARPLWKLPRLKVLDLLAHLQIDYIVTMTLLDKLPTSISERLVGHLVTQQYLLDQFDWYDSNHPPLDLRNTVDLAGEYGEMHSMVRDCPLFSFQVVHLGKIRKVHQTKYGSYMYLCPDKIHIVPK
ncbi:hypothetical protein BX661DRAFT_186298 [Kickxella alabastrina]|uniref:uncharacterized protein n=1 Tax=Kickxella alabastrina TaxID=61397 RepID=UPI00221F3E49|nr:uncharacterized protein BX661DRAFT_186298 [Kickxella alabastrina]KAI7823717.1 hypothetical protein BX661DRAFT_186298 [Kickxella alabastrina]